MGTVASALLGATKTLKVVVGILRDLYTQFNELDARFNEAPGLPRPSPTQPFWLEDPPYPELVDVQSKVLPEQADVVIIGSGITGVAVARSLLGEPLDGSKASEPPSVVVLEARQLCSGATGRNGGHIKASPHETIDNLITKRGIPGERAAALVRFQLAHLHHLVALCEAEAGLNDVAECREVETVDLFVDEARFEEAQRMAALLKKWVPEFEITAWPALEAQKKFSAGPRVVGATSYVAGALWPYRLVTGLWRRLLDAHPDSLFIETSTPAEAVEVDSSSSQHPRKTGTAYPYRVVTPRGVIRARHVVHATNAFATQLLPQMRRKITGFRCHMSAQQPGPRFPDLGGQRSWSIIYGSGFDYITQRPTRVVTDRHTGKDHSEPGELMAGGGFMRSAGNGLDQMAVFDDSTTDLFTEIHLHGILPPVFAPYWGPEGGSDTNSGSGSSYAHGGASKEGGEGHVKSFWSGIVAATADLVPFVGRLEPRLTGRRLPDAAARQIGSAGEWISAAYMGDGMVWAWLSGTALGLMVAGREHEDLPPAPGRPAGRVVDWLPPEMLPAYDRVKKIDITDLADLIM